MAPVLGLDKESITRAASVIEDGGLVVIPTDTVYGIACDPFNEAAVGRLFDAKKREPKPIPVLCSDPSRAAELVDLGDVGARLAISYWPGALTIVAPLRRPVPLRLDQGTSTLGVRVPAHAKIVELIERVGGWTTGTSANLSGNTPSKTATEANKQVGKGVDLVLNGGPLSGSVSTVVSVIGNKVAILRSGRVRVQVAKVGR